MKKKVDDNNVKIFLPLFKVDLQVNDSNKSIFDLLTLCRCTVSVETPKKSPSVPQCARCQDIGHMKNYCKKTPRCVKCSGEHLFQNCRAPKSAAPKCANCGGKHTASYEGCEVYQAKLHSSKPQKKITAVDRISSSSQPKIAPATAKAGKPQYTYAAMAANGSEKATNVQKVPINAEFSQCNPLLPNLSSTLLSTESTKMLDMLSNLVATQQTLLEKLDKLRKGSSFLKVLLSLHLANVNRLKNDLQPSHCLLEC